jgi:hypothetical protein
MSEQWEKGGEMLQRPEIQYRQELEHLVPFLGNIHPIGGEISL